MKKDQHVNTSMSKDNNSCMEAYIRNAFTKEVDEITVVDQFNPLDPETLNVDDYYYEYIRFMKNEITPINLGIEVVLSTEQEESIKEALSSYNFDLIVGTTSEITTDGDKDAYQEYLLSVLKNVKKYKNEIDVVSSHIDLIKQDNKDSILLSYQDIIDEILINLINNNIGIEVNSSSFKCRNYNNIPSIEILKRYKELGGSIITIGSYACTVDDLSLYFENVYSILENLGFESISQFHKRIPEQIELSRLKRVG